MARKHELVGETLRDIGILLVVFAPLDTLLRSDYGTRKDWLIAVGIAVLGSVLIFIGIQVGSDR